MTNNYNTPHGPQGPPKDDLGYALGRIEGKLDGLSELLQAHKETTDDQLTRQERELAELRAETDALRNWRSRVLGIAAAVALAFSLAADELKEAIFGTVS